MRLSLRLLSSVVQRTPYYITTPIFYVNAEPHIGHLYTAVLADAVQRFEKLTNPHLNIIFSTGTDEHGTKVQQAAAAARAPLQQYCDDIAEQYRQLFQEHGVQYTRFVRTTEEKHKKAVTHFWRELVARDYVYKARYSGWYSVSDECFVPPAQLADELRDGKQVKVSVESGHPVEWTEEENYMFRLSAFREHLQKWLQTDGVIVPAAFQASARALLGAGYLADISVSRPSGRVHWAIRVPDDPSQSIYVWVDALVNYLTSIGYPDVDEMKANGRPWPADLQVVGKDILKFHAVYWPALLMAVGRAPPRRILAHAHWTRDGVKMSKSRGNVLAPRRLGPLPPDALRYVLLREATLAQDANFSETKFINICNSELAHTLGNLLSRSLALCPLTHTPPYTVEYEGGAAEKELMDRVERLADVCHAHYSSFQFHKAADAVMSCLRAANGYFDAAAPWRLRDERDAPRLRSVLHASAEALRVAALVLQPLAPALAARLLARLGVAPAERAWRHARAQWTPARALPPAAACALFPRIQREASAPPPPGSKQKKKKLKA